MRSWYRISALLCTYGFFREFRPNEPFVSEFLSGPWRDLTVEQVTQLVYPVGTYSYLALLVVAFLVTDMLRYKPLIIVSAVAGIVVYVMLLWTTSLGALQACQFFYGVFMATEVAYFTYIYAKVDREHYPAVTGFTKSAMLVGRFSAAVVGQLMISFALLDFRALNYITLGTQAISLLWAVLLPTVATSVYFYAASDSPASSPAASPTAPVLLQRNGDHLNGAARRSSKAVAASAGIELNEKTGDGAIGHRTSITAGRSDVERPAAQVETAVVSSAPLAGRFSARRAMRLLWTHFCESYSNAEVVQWSLWWALTMCGFTQVQTYVQFLWQAIDPNRDALYNGAVEAALTLLGAAAAFAAGYINVERFDRWSLWVLSVVSGLMAGMLLWATLTELVWVSYVMYVLFGTATHFMVTVASINVAKRLRDDSFGLVFGINTLLALVFQTVLTVVVVSDAGLGLAARDQFKVNSGYFAVLGVCFGLTAVVRLVWRRCRRRP